VEIEFSRGKRGGNEKAASKEERGKKRKRKARKEGRGRNKRRKEERKEGKEERKERLPHPCRVDKCPTHHRGGLAARMGIQTVAKLKPRFVSRHNFSRTKEFFPRTKMLGGTALQRCDKPEPESEPGVSPKVA
jgi:hypothetical protein